MITWLISYLNPHMFISLVFLGVVLLYSSYSFFSILFSALCHKLMLYIWISGKLLIRLLIMNCYLNFGISVYVTVFGCG